jgi:hypothetical protein
MFQSIAHYFLVAVAVTLGVYFAWVLRRVLLYLLIPAGLGVAVYFSWYHFTGQEEKSKSAKEEQRHKQFRSTLVEDTRRVESNSRVGYHPKHESEPVDTSPFGGLEI